LASRCDRLRPTPPKSASADRLGLTILNISDISYGSSRTADAGVVRHALARGINYFDTAESYKGGAAEESLGVALAGHREEVIPGTGRICLIRSVVVRTLLTGGTENAA
jgi:diketogulonate reductase-like aldo/keto reductase